MAWPGDEYYVVQSEAPDSSHGMTSHGDRYIDFQEACREYNRIAREYRNLKIRLVRAFQIRETGIERVMEVIYYRDEIRR